MNAELEFPILASQSNLLGYIQNQILDAGACPACGSLFLLHLCHANPVRGKGLKEAKPKIQGLRADRVILDEIDNFPGPYDELLGF